MRCGRADVAEQDAVAASSQRGRIELPQLTGCGADGSAWIEPISLTGSGRTVSARGRVTARSGAISASACAGAPR